MQHALLVLQRRFTSVLARLYRRIVERGVLSTLSEGMFLLARRLASGPHDSAHRSHAAKRGKLEKKVRQLRGTVTELSEKTKDQKNKLTSARSSLAETKRRLSGLVALEKETRGKAKELSHTLRQLKKGPLFAYESSLLAGQRCFVCNEKHTHLLPYPYATSPTFSRLLVFLCSGCGFGWVPVIPFDLNEYYRTEYGVSNRADRELSPEAYFVASSDAPHPGGVAVERYFARSRFQLDLVRAHRPEIGAMLDFGAGPGCALFLSQAAQKHAIEPDARSRKYLDYIGATCLSLSDAQPGFYDVVLSSHSLEHLPVSELFPTLSKLRAVVKEGGVLCVEVPVASLGETYLPVRHEPHTLFFTPDSLERILERAGFTILERRTRLPSSRQALQHPLRAPAAGRWYSTTDDGLVVLATPNGREATPPSVPILSATVLSPT